MKKVCLVQKIQKKSPAKNLSYGKLCTLDTPSLLSNEPERKFVLWGKNAERKVSVTVMVDFTI